MHHIGPNEGCLLDVIGGAHRGHQNFRVKPVIVIDLADFGNELHPFEMNVIKTAHERRNERGPRLGRKQRLVGTEAQRDIDHGAIRPQAPCRP